MSLEMLRPLVSSVLRTVVAQAQAALGSNYCVLQYFDFVCKMLVFISFGPFTYSVADSCIVTANIQCVLGLFHISFLWQPYVSMAYLVPEYKLGTRDSEVLNYTVRCCSF